MFVCERVCVCRVNGSVCVHVSVCVCVLTVPQSMRKAASRLSFSTDSCSAPG